MLKMHIVVRIWHFVVIVFVLIAYTMVIINIHVVVNLEGIWNEASSVQILRQIVESNIIPMWWVDFIDWQ